MDREPGLSRLKRRTPAREAETATLTRTMTLIAAGNPLPVILEAIVQCVEAEHPTILGQHVTRPTGVDRIVDGSQRGGPAILNFPQ